MKNIPKKSEVEIFSFKLSSTALNFCDIGFDFLSVYIHVLNKTKKIHKVSKADLF